jgi:hypothetical protein
VLFRSASTGVATFSAGTVSAPAITTTGDTNTGIFFPAADTIAFTEGGVESMRIDASGSVGIGNVSPQARLDLGIGASGRKFNVYNDNTNAISGLGVDISGASFELSCYAGGNGANLGTFTWLAYNRTANTYAERMRINGSGLVGIGTNNPVSMLNVNASSNTNCSIFLQNQTTAIGVFGTEAAWLGTGSSNNLAISSYGANSVIFGAGGIERMRITNGGNVGVGVTPTNKLQAGYDVPSSVPSAGAGAHGLAVGSGGFGLAAGALSNGNAYIQSTRWDGTAATYDLAVQTRGGSLLVGTAAPFSGSTHSILCPTTSGVPALNVQHPATTDAIRGIFSGCPNYAGDDGYLFIAYRSGSDRLYIRTSGNVQNANNSYGGISDIKLKENIVDATPKLANLMNVKIRNYNLKTDPTQKQIGVIAQELEEVFPALVEESKLPDQSDTIKTVKYSVFVPILIKAMQEQQSMIEQLTTRINALEGK